MPEPPAEAVQSAADGKPVLIEPRHAQHRRRHRQAARDRGRLSLHDPAGRPGGDQGAPDRDAPTPTNIAAWRRTAARRRSPSRCSISALTLIIVLSAIWTGIAVADRLVRPIRQLIGAADEVATGNLDVAGAGARLRRRRRLARRHVQQDAAGAEVAAQRDPDGQGPRSTSAGASRRRCWPASPPASSASIPTGTITIVNRSAETMLAISATARARAEPVGSAAACRPRLRDRPQVRARRSIASR